MMIDAIVESDEHLMEKYLSEGELTAEELEHAIPHALEAGTVIPIFCTAAKKEIGIDELMDAFAKESLSPSHAEEDEGDPYRARPCPCTENNIAYLTLSLQSFHCPRIILPVISVASCPHLSIKISLFFK